MSTREKIIAGTTFWAGEDILTAYNFKEGAISGQGYICRDGSSFHCDVRAFHSDHIEIFYKFFGTWVDSKIYYESIAFSPEEIVERIKAQVPTPKPKHIVRTGPTDKIETRALVKYMNALCNEVPSGLSSLKDSLTFAMLDLNFYNGYGVKNKTFDDALAFGRSIPHFEDLKSDECANWMLHDEEHLKYM